MKNIQVIDGAQNCVYDIFAATDEEFAMISTRNRHCLYCEIYANGDNSLLDAAFENIWQRPIKKAEAEGIQGTIFYELEYKKVYYPTRRDVEAVNPDGSDLR